RESASPGRSSAPTRGRTPAIAGGRRGARSRGSASPQPALHTSHRFAPESCSTSTSWSS
ncbi:hypothetical protein EMIHUDRAFT_367776, partial [Emiliania huxleyi CCMP1516]|uniref:Uncharacterized protein n=2 Tax=Emiliania huxleyi TaxID=2903 RepID=A0A0D3JL03_EMIH1